MQRKWMSALGALVIGFGIVAGGETGMAKEKHKEILNVSHRGASGYAPEHTITSYKMGEKMHGDYIEIDLQMTKDGKLIAMHDERLDRTTNGTGLVKDYTLEQLKQLDAGSWFNEQYPQYANPEYAGLQIPTLEDVFQKFGKNKKYYIETKSPEVYPGMEKELLRLVNEYDINKETLLVQSFSPASLLTMKELDPSIKLVQLLSYKTNAVITDEEIAAIKEYAMGVGPNYTYLNEEYIQKVVNNGLEIHPFTVNDKETMEKLIDWGVTGMFTNFPDLLHEVTKGK
ncbi:glycerophosphodiester phosphodiesterase [Peribacillus cavernae]|uniref:Glycerophosphodiester phosphodiesterase n=1 Tax=Peribacillus cavernae TaxID=1674310 RepID=A0A433HFQ1_9BACI|nr:glycerophosphodiester phosphodiesterase [Peribacillus cavernae]MDQ0219467.1 glycerophosphoryl diester phosphodiesterase [Peribacillus cavernae]RUQ27110.1 glycerophosphodiester phosphodiesterase [Peribacillus cavernae]